MLLFLWVCSYFCCWDTWNNSSDKSGYASFQKTSSTFGVFVLLTPVIQKAADGEAWRSMDGSVCCSLRMDTARSTLRGIHTQFWEI